MLPSEPRMPVDLLGPLIAEFKDFRAGVMRVMGLMLAVPGVALLVVGFLADLEWVRVFGVIGMVLGAAFFAIGYWRQNNQLLVYTNGLVQLTRGEMEFRLWRDVQEVAVEQEWRYHHFGMYKTVRNTCYLQDQAGAWVEVNAVPITGPVMKAIRQSCDGAGMGWHQGKARWSL